MVQWSYGHLSIVLSVNSSFNLQALHYKILYTGLIVRILGDSLVMCEQWIILKEFLWTFVGVTINSGKL